jgi:pilus assembly protein CpaE
MKIAVIASTADLLSELQNLLEHAPGQDQFIFLQRHGDEIRLDRLDLLSTHILILDSKSVDQNDLRLIAATTREHINPAVIYLCGEFTGPQLLEVMRSGVSEVVGLPLKSVELAEAIERIRSRHYISSSHHPRGKVISFISCKGGAGATFLATNLGYTLATECHQKVLYIDLHMQYGDALFYLTDTTSNKTLADIIKQSGLDSTVIATTAMHIADNYYLLQAPDGPEKATGITAQHVDNLLTVAIQSYDYVVVDLPHAVDSLTMKVLDRSQRIFTVMQPMVPYVRAMANQLRVFRLLGYESNKVSVVLNRNDKNGSLSTDRMEDVIQKKIDQVIPNDFLNAAEAVNMGVPLVKMSPTSVVSASLIEMAQDLCGVMVNANKRGFLSRLLG